MSYLISSSGMICIDMTINTFLYNDRNISTEGGEILQITTDPLILEQTSICRTELSSKVIGILTKSADIPFFKDTMRFEENENSEGGEGEEGENSGFNVIDDYEIPENVIAIKGVCPVRIIGYINKGDNIVSAGYYGVARRSRNSYEEKYSIGISLETIITNDTINYVQCFIK